MGMTEREGEERGGKGRGKGREGKGRRGSRRGGESTVLLLCINNNLVYCFQIPRGKVKSPQYYSISARGERFMLRPSTF